MKKTTMIALGIILVSFIIGIYLYPQMPERMASHWNAKGEVDGYMSRFWGLFLMPIVSVGLLVLFIFIPRIDPLKKNIERFMNYYDWFIVLFILFLFYLQVLSLLWNLEYRFDISQMLAPGFGILFYYIGVLVENAKTNWFIGIRTPWTLSNKKVWDKVHNLGGKMYKIAGGIAILGIFFKEYMAILVMVVPVVAATLYLVIYSYFEYQKVKR